MILYKYTKLEYLEKILENSSFKLSNPDEFNDPFDCLVEADENEKKKCFDLMMNYVFFKEMEKIFLSRETKLKTRDKIISACFRLELKLTRSTIKKYKFYNPIPIVNGFIKLGAKYKLGQDFNDQIDKAKLEFSKMIETKVKEIRDSLLICCYGKRNDSILMWSHYANCHKGVCIEFEPYNDIDITEIKYSKKRAKLDLYSITQTVLAYDYLQEKVDIKNKNVARRLLKPFLVKSKDWKYEEEYRSIYSKNEINEKITSLDNMHFINAGNIKAVYLGCKVSVEDEKLVRKMTKDIPVYRMKESDKEYRVESVK